MSTRFRRDRPRRLAMPKTLTLSLPGDPSLKPAPVLLVSRSSGIRSLLFLLQLRIRARPVFLPPTLEFIRTIGLSIRGDDPGCRAERRNEGPVPVLSQPKTSKMFPQQEDHPEFSAVLLVVLERLCLPQGYGVECLDD